jgi:hypothetical protein
MEKLSELFEQARAAQAQDPPEKMSQIKHIFPERLADSEAAA